MPASATATPSIAATPAFPVKTRELHNHHFDSTDLERLRASATTTSSSRPTPSPAPPGRSRSSASCSSTATEGVRGRRDVALARPARAAQAGQAARRSRRRPTAASSRRICRSTRSSSRRRRKYLYIGRDGRDVVWSMYNHHANANDIWYEALNDTPGRVGPPIEPPPARRPPVLPRLAGRATAIRSGRSGRTSAAGGRSATCRTSSWSTSTT